MLQAAMLTFILRNKINYYGVIETELTDIQEAQRCARFL